ncbi:hypothetical protein [Deinococcus peraridilitoris]|uniref:Uncharacterized protein n=1 Tax=Deinococcus peraridilitoris (strain DSM 19664 / LMG 22246 / CIP 109416 / KR-200) TaxID=937777 RepID=L0A136_DEIPD|nr:hypothetical protein [Deinococcus peraridilitoris]AFZ67556.1 hypothetical protein Deipe_2060 [Deinococcus peraridilitoris DSM 19664]
MTTVPCPSCGLDCRVAHAYRDGDLARCGNCRQYVIIRRQNGTLTLQPVKVTP